ncbi:hypothetical protein ND748_00190 [Frankia sp. AiPs1]|uniref:hypothetical protein n=1 Tax=Frankia sp. AiPs1 TaxID=573493 RepID=UPI00204401CB|nr:hypothetical protein [Frankia sp. AiPs1]MCM3920115.1 hypothetical protein [Frankia sp. AiPs1]
MDVGARTASDLVDRLLERGDQDVTVLDLAADALAVTHSRLGARADGVHWPTSDLLARQPPQRYRLRYDRAVFPFLTNAHGQDRHLAALSQALAPGR